MSNPPIRQPLDFRSEILLKQGILAKGNDSSTVELLAPTILEELLMVMITNEM